jgi:hypothetical protein
VAREVTSLKTLRLPPALLAVAIMAAPTAALAAEGTRGPSEVIFF